METVPEDVTEVTEVTPVEALSDQQDSEDEVMSVEVEIEQEGATNSSDETVGKTGEDSTKPEVPTETLVERIDEEVQGAVGGRMEAPVDNLASDHKPIGAKRSFDHLGETVLIVWLKCSVLDKSLCLDWSLLLTKQSQEVRQSRPRLS